MFTLKDKKLEKTRKAFNYS